MTGLSTGWHLLESSCHDVFPAATFLDVAGSEVGRLSTEKMVRPYFRGRPDPGEMATRAAAWGKDGTRIVLANEPNLDTEGFGGGPADYAAWFTAVARRVTDARLYYAGMSPGVDGWQEWLTHPAARQAIRRNAAGLCVHAYGTFDQMRAVVQFYLDTFPDKHLWLSEVNFGAGQRVDRDAWARDHFRPFLDWCADRSAIEGVTYFAFVWPTPDVPLPTPVDGAGTGIERVLREWQPNGDTVVTNVTVPAGRGWWVWYADACGGAGGIVAKARQAGCSHVLVKGGDGATVWDQLTPGLVDALHAAGLGVHGWHYVYGDDPDGEAAVAGAILATGVDGYVADAEAEYEGKATAAGHFCALVRAAAGSRFFGYSPLPHVDYHESLPYVQFNAVCDAVLPQWYGENMTAQAPPGEGYPVERFVSIWTRWSQTWRAAGLRVPPLMPVGETYGEATADGIRAFEAAVKVQEYPAWSYWSMQHASAAHLAALEELAMAEAPKTGQTPDPPRDRTWALLDELQALAPAWEAAGWPSTAAGIAASAEAAKSLVRASKAER